MFYFLKIVGKILIFALSKLFRKTKSSHPGKHEQWVKSASEALCLPSAGPLTWQHPLLLLSPTLTHLEADPVSSLRQP